MQYHASANDGVRPDFTPTRRHLFALAALPLAVPAASIASVMPTQSRRMTAQRRAILASEAADVRFCGLPEDLETTDYARHKAEEDAMIAAYQRVVDTPPADWGELVTLISFVSDEGVNGMTDEAVAAVMRYARMLEGK